MSSHISIPFFDYPALYNSERKELLALIDNVCSRGAFIMQQDLVDFEHNLARFVGSKHAIGVADGTMALILSLKGAGVGSGDEFIVPSHTFVASAAAIHHVGARPVLCDCRKDHLIDPESIERLITPQTKGIMPVQLNGRTADMDSITAIANKHNLIIIEDSAQALGSKFKNRSAGTFGKAGTFSFFPAKTLGCFGDGGAVITDDDEIAERIISYRDHGRNYQTGDVDFFGYNSRLDNIQAAILNYKLQQYPAVIERRRAIARKYTDLLGDVPQLLLPPGPDADPRHFDIYQNYEVEAERRDELRLYLTEKGIGTIIQWGGKCIHQFVKLGLNYYADYTESMTAKFILLPINMTLTDDNIEYICDTICRFYKTVAK